MKNYQGLQVVLLDLDRRLFLASQEARLDLVDQEDQLHLVVLLALVLLPLFQDHLLALLCLDYQQHLEDQLDQVDQEAQVVRLLQAYHRRL